MAKSCKRRLPTPRLPVDPAALEHARRMRTDVGGAERRLWYLLRAKRFGGLKFRRQHVVGRYILDYYCDECRLDVEIDGDAHTHPDKAARDALRDEALGRLGIVTLRFWSSEVLSNTEGVLHRLWEVTEARRKPDRT